MLALPFLHSGGGPEMGLGFRFRGLGFRGLGGDTRSLDYGSYGRFLK